MNKRGLSRAQIFLIELIFMILFFAISAAVLLQVFFKARELFLDSACLSAAVIAAESTAEETLSLNVTEAGKIETLRYYDGHWTPSEKDSAVYRVESTWSSQPSSGQLTDLTVIVVEMASHEIIHTLETTKYYAVTEGGN